MSEMDQVTESVSSNPSGQSDFREAQPVKTPECDEPSAPRFRPVSSLSDNSATVHINARREDRMDFLRSVEHLLEDD